MIYVGTAGWSIPRQVASHFAGEGSHLMRYAKVFACAEINSSFYRSHARATYERWAEQTPDDFRFAVKVPQEISHDNALRRARTPLRAFFGEIAGLHHKLGPLLLQLPPSLEFESRIAAQFFALLRSRHDGAVVCEPRHASWFSERADALMRKQRIARVAADPSRHPDSKRPGGYIDAGGKHSVLYYRLHGSPRKHWSTYSETYLDALAAQFERMPNTMSAWCIFDNTASGAAAANAWELQRKVSRA